MSGVSEQELTSLDHSESLKKQVAWAEQEFIAAIKEQQLLKHEIESIQQDLEGFESEYHERVGALLEELDALEKQLNTPAQTPSTPSTPATPTPPAADIAHIPMIPGMGADMNDDEVGIANQEDERRHDEAVETESKRLYRKLVKKAHPDSAKDEPEASEAFALLKESHENNDLSTLLLLERALDTNTEAPLRTQLDSLQQQREHLIRQNDKLKWQRHELLHGDTYTLKIRVLNAKLENKDLLAGIAASITIQINEKKRLLQTARYQNG